MRPDCENHQNFVSTSVITSWNISFPDGLDLGGRLVHYVCTKKKENLCWFIIVEYFHRSPLNICRHWAQLSYFPPSSSHPKCALVKYLPLFPSVNEVGWGRWTSLWPSETRIRHVNTSDTSTVSDPCACTFWQAKSEISISKILLEVWRVRWRFDG